MSRREVAKHWTPLSFTYCDNTGVNFRSHKFHLTPMSWGNGIVQTVYTCAADLASDFTLSCATHSLLSACRKWAFDSKINRRRCRQLVNILPKTLFRKSSLNIHSSFCYVWLNMLSSTNRQHIEIRSCSESPQSAHAEYVHLTTGRFHAVRFCKSIVLMCVCVWSSLRFDPSVCGLFFNQPWLVIAEGILRSIFWLCFMT